MRKPMTWTVSCAALACSILPRSHGEPPQVSSPSVSTTISPGFLLIVEHLGRLLDRRRQRRLAGRDQRVHLLHDESRGVRHRA